jgi:uncharacterized protein (TIGR02284 family)
MLVMERRTEDELKELIRLNKDAARGFSLAAERAEDMQYSAYLDDIASTRRAYEITLAELGRRHGVDIDSLDTHPSADAHRAWMEIADALTESDDALISECIRGEQYTAREYALAQSNHMWPETLDRALRSQHRDVLNTLSTLREIDARTQMSA